MCGIAAIFAYDNSAPGVDDGELRTIRDCMTARGPDGTGEWYDAGRRIGLGHRRLSIIDLSPGGAQPMLWPERKLAITFNGEIYNYRELRTALEQKGHVFHSTSDTEVLLRLYAEHGEAMVNELRGMYAFAIWDGEKRGLLLARDPFGIKPLYWADDGKTLRAASQVKALLAGGRIDTAPEPAGHVGFFLWGHVSEPYTFYRAIRMLAPGATIWIDQNGAKRTRTFCSIPRILADSEDRSWKMEDGLSQLPTPNSHLRSALVDSVRHHLVADVPVGVFLSSGLDSTTLAALAAEQGGTLRTVTLGFEEYRGTENDETPLAEAVARRYGAQHQTVWVRRYDFREHIERLFAAMDQPSTDGVNTYFVSLAAARTSLKVALSGLGGDELFGGYPSFDQVPRMARALKWFPPGNRLGRTFRAIAAPLVKHFISPKYAGLLEYGGSFSGAYLLRRGMFMPWELPEILDGDLVRQGWAELQPILRLDETLNGLRSPRAKVSSLEMCWYMRNQLLRDSDWAGMAHSLEIRVPLVDVALLRALAPSLAGSTPPTKLDMASSPLSPLPSSVLNRPKTGFLIPVRQWLMSDLQPSTCNSQPAGERGLRSWTKYVYQRFAGTDMLVRGKRSQLSPSAPRPRPTGLPSTDAPPTGLRASATRILVLATDAFGGHGGIAKFNRDLLSALSVNPAVQEVVALPRLMPEPPGELPARLRYVTASVGGKFRYIKTVLTTVLRSPASDVLICGHINLLPIAFLARLLMRKAESRKQTAESGRTESRKQKAENGNLPASCSLLLVVHGIDAWQPTRSWLANRLVRKIDAFISVSELTRQRFLSWTKLDGVRSFILPNCVDLSRFGPGPKNSALLQRYQLQGRTVLLTVGRLVSAERFKGFDEVLEVLPELAKQVPNLTYLIVGGGDDRERLIGKAKSLGLSVMEDRREQMENRRQNSTSRPSPISHLPSPDTPSVVFAGRIPEAEKVDHYRLADVYVMPSRGEGFGIVFLEAMACGLPVIGSKFDGSREALRNGELGILVDPGEPGEIQCGILAALKNARGVVPPGLEYFSAQNFETRVRLILEELLKATVTTTGIQDNKTTGPLTTDHRTTDR